MKKGFFQDGNGNDSIMRLIVFMVAVIGGAVLITQTVFWCMDHNTHINFAELTLFIAPAFISKVAQKIAENNDKPKL
jgi:hypothetical protein